MHLGFPTIPTFFFAEQSVFTPPLYSDAKNPFPYIVRLLITKSVLNRLCSLNDPCSHICQTSFSFDHFTFSSKLNEVRSITSLKYTPLTDDKLLHDHIRHVSWHCDWRAWPLASCTPSCSLWDHPLVTRYSILAVCLGVCNECCCCTGFYEDCKILVSALFIRYCYWYAVFESIYVRVINDDKSLLMQSSSISMTRTHHSVE